MENHIVEELKYPIGVFQRKEHYPGDEFEQLVLTIEQAPGEYQQLTAELSVEDLAKTYRPGSWNVKQLVHHLADIQLLHFLRMKKALTEYDYKEVTLIDMDAWASTADSTSAPIADSLTMLSGITRRFIVLIRSLQPEDLEKSYYHPVRKYSINQYQAIAMAAWHLQHHLAHIKIAMGRGR